MSEIKDDLLDELKDLEDSTQNLEDQVDVVIDNQQKLDKLSTENSSQSAIFMLESSRLAHDACEYSQQAAEINLKLSKEQQMQIDDLHQAANNWRQAARSTSETMGNAKGFFIVLLILSLIISIAFAGSMAWYIQNNIKSQQQLQQEMLDMIQTETGIYQKQITLKIDELASVIETLSIQQNTIKNSFSEPVPTAETPQQPNLASEIAVDLLAEVALPTETPVVEMQALELKTDQTESQQTPPSMSEQQNLAQTNESGTVMMPSPASAEITLALENQKQLLNQLTDQLASLQQRIEEQKSKPTQDVMQPIASLETLLKTQSKQVQNLTQKLNRHIQQFNKQQAAANQQSNSNSNSNNEIKKQLNRLSLDFLSIKQQQSELEKAIQELSETVKQGFNKANETKPYSYRNPYEYRK